MIVEIALFKTKAGVTDDQVVAASDAIQREVETFDGYLGRRLCKSNDGQWADVVEWTDEDAALRVAHEFENMACAQDFMRIEEPGSSRILLVHPVKEYPGTQVGETREVASSLSRA